MSYGKEVDLQISEPSLSRRMVAMEGILSVNNLIYEIVKIKRISIILYRELVSVKVISTGRT